MKEKARLRDAERRAAYAAAGFDAAAWESIKDEYGRRCACCGAPETEARLTIDHITPLARGGNHEAENIQPLCLACNMRKHVRIINYREGYEVIDMDAVPLEFMKVNALKVLDEVRAMKKSTIIPGIEAFPKPRATFRRTS